jgi:hypothetical protein
MERQNMHTGEHTIKLTCEQIEDRREPARADSIRIRDELSFVAHTRASLPERSLPTD